MFQHTLSIYMVKRMTYTNIFIEQNELEDLLTHLTATEIKVYSYLKFSPKHNRSPEDFKADALAGALGMAVQTLRNTLSRLKSKGYAQIEFFKDNRKNLGVKVIVGKDQMELYGLGLDVEIKDAKTYTDVITKFPLTDPTLSIAERKQLVKSANEYVRGLTK